MKKGFTLIELLAVIIILAILMIVAVPNVLGTLNDAKKSTFATQAKSLWTSAEQQYVLKQMNGTTVAGFNSTAAEASKIYSLDLSTIASNVTYCMTVDANGKVTRLVVDDGTYRLDKTTINDLEAKNVVASTGAATCS